MAPEQARGRWDEVDAQSDLWSLGATMFWLLTATTVHDAGTVQEQLAATFTVLRRALGDARAFRTQRGTRSAGVAGIRVQGLR